MEQFSTWSKNQGIVSNARVENTPYAGYGLFATKDSCNNPVVHVPFSALLSSQKAIQKGPFAETLQILYKLNSLDEIAQIYEKQVICLFLIYCQFFDETTEWKSYMDILPSIAFFKQNHPLFNLQYLQGTSLEHSVRAKLHKLRKELEMINQANSNWLSKIDIEMYKWADCVFWSRVVGIGSAAASEASVTSNMVLVPYFDFANHSANSPNMRWQPTLDGGIDLVTYPDMVKEGDELLLSYGSKPNQELLFLHCFCVENNPNSSCFTLPASPFLNPEDDPLNIPKIRWLKHAGVKPTLNLSRSVKDTELLDIGWAYESIIVMYLVAMNENDGIQFSLDKEENVQLHIKGKKITTLEALEQVTNGMRLLPVIQLRVIMLLIDALQYQYSMNTDHAMIDETPIAKQALVYRNEEKALLESALQTLSKLSDKLMKDEIVIEYLENTQ
ncbi:hypothetical protein [Parasitella parasitica]|uniref:Uncharacterized protein n=1 Tax=Parasitella parasitica TaxID=35722 RepID=A0A0B7MQ10_9FUNG|nr:hypothetical protein [Parasitella parasitica]